MPDHANGQLLPFTPSCPGPKQREGQTIDSQVAGASNATPRTKGWRLVDVYKDEGLERSLPLARPGL